MKRFTEYICIVFLGFISLLCCAPSYQPSSAERALSGESIGIRYYRVKADYSVKDTGEKISFDYVVACGATVYSSLHTTSSVEYSFFPMQMITSTATGEAIGLRTPQLCAEWVWEPGAIPDDFMTFAMWYPDVDHLRFAIGYESDLAYESPYARLEFHGASVVQVRYEDWVAWREKAKTDWEAEYSTEPVGGLPGPWGFNYSIHGGDKEAQAELEARNFGDEPAGAYCDQVSALDLPQSKRSAVLELLPEGNQQFWSSMHSKELSDFIYTRRGALISSGEQVYNGGRFGSHMDQWHELGVRRSGGPIRKSKSGRVNISNGGGRVFTQGLQGNYYHDVYPVLYEDIGERLEIEKPEYVAARYNITEKWNGFSFCKGGIVNVSYQDIVAYAMRQANSLPVVYPPTPRLDAIRAGFPKHRWPSSFHEGVKTRSYVNDDLIREEPEFTNRHTKHIFGRNGRIYSRQNR